MQPKPLILIDTEYIGGPGKGLFQFLRCAAPAGLEYVLSSITYPRAQSTEFQEAAGVRRLNYHPIHQRFKFDPALVAQTVRLIRSAGCNLIQSHNYKSHAIAALAARWTGLPWIAFAHGWTAEDRKVALYNACDRWLLRYADLVVTVSPQMQAGLAAKRNGKKTELLWNAVEPAELTGIGASRDIRASCGLLEDGLLLGCFGRLSFEKGQDLLIEAFSKIAYSFPLVKLLLLGDGPDRIKLMQQAARKQLSKRIFFHGYKSNLRDYYEAIDLLIIPSRSEGLPNVALEACALGCPILSTDVGALREVLREGKGGWLVPVENAAQRLAESLERLLAEPALLPAAGQLAKVSTLSKFSAQLRAEKLLAFYQETLACFAARTRTRV